jgi:hypothetical protein
VANNYYGVNVADNEYQAASSTSGTTSKDVEIVVNASNVTSREALLLSIEKLWNFILRSSYPL